MSKIEVMSPTSTVSKLSPLSIIDELENECYLDPDFNSGFKNEVKTKIEEFSNWFNSTARLYLLRCGPQESEMFIYLLLNLKKKLKFAISEINRSANNLKQSYTCNICGEQITVEPCQNVWKVLQDHPHFEETYSQTQIVEPTCSDNTAESVTTNDSIDDLSEDLNQLSLAEPDDEKPPENSLNSFKFNFVVNYDQRVEEALYPEPLITAARRRDNVSEYTVQRCGVGRGICLLCPCSLMSKGRGSKITPFVIKNHVSGQKHLKFASNSVNTSALKGYHDFWRGQDPSFQAHQAYFVPEVGLDLLKCQLCLEFVDYDWVIEHIKGVSHKNKVLKIFQSPEGKTNEFYLLDMQVQVYDIVVNHKKEEKMKEVKSESNGVPPPKCDVLKFDAVPNGLNLPMRYKEHLDFLTKKSDLLVACKICKISFENNITVMKKHVLTGQHKLASGIAYPKFKFFCEICHLHLKDEDAWSDHFVKGPNRHDSLPPTRKQKVTEYECKTCSLVFFGDELSVTRHNSSRGKSRAKEVRLPASVKKLFKSNLFIEAEAKYVQYEANLVQSDQEKMEECCLELEQALSAYFPNCKTYPFGSRISGLGNKQSDLDVFMDTGDMYLGEKLQDSQTQEVFVKKVGKVLKSKTCKDDFSRVVAIPSARTPIVKLHHNDTDLDCDLSFRHGLGVENTKFLRFCIELQPITQPLILLLKKWSDCCKLNEHITNYGLALMAVFFLQTGGYLLPVKTVRNYNPSKSLVIDGWDTLNYTVPQKKMNEFVKSYPGTIKQLLRDFFSYFAKFDYVNQVVCPLLGNTIPKVLFSENPNESLPIEMKSYVQRIQNENAEKFRSSTLFCVQDPFDLSHNLTKACQSGTINKFKALCTLTCEWIDTIE